MKFVLVEIYRRSISLFYYDDEKKGTRAFETINGSVPLAIAYINGRYEIGQTALIAVKNGQVGAYDNLFSLMDKDDISCGDVNSSQFIPKLIRKSLDDYFILKNGSSYRDDAENITLVLLFGNDVMSKESDVLAEAFKDDGFASVKSMSQSVESVKCFRMSPKYNWSRETDAMVVRSDGIDLSIKSFSLSDYHLISEHLYKDKGSDPRFEWALNDLYNKIVNLTYCSPNEVRTSIAEALEKFIASNQLELREIKLPDCNTYSVYLHKDTYNRYSPPNATKFLSLISDIVKDTGQKYETTGIVLQGKTANNRFFHESFNFFDPISDETDEFRGEIRSQILKELLGVKPAIVEPIVSIISYDGTKFNINVKHDGGAPVTDRGICWSTHHNPTLSDSYISNGLGLGDFSADLSEIQKGKSFYARAFATNSVGTGFSDEILFTTGTDTGFTDDPNDDGRRKFAMSFEVGRQGLTKTLTVKAEILDGKRLPFDCMFTIDADNFLSYKPDQSFCEKCERGKSGILEFGPYELPLEEIGASDMLYAHIWPADKEKSPNIFKKNHLKIKL